MPVRHQRWYTAEETLIIAGVFGHLLRSQGWKCSKSDGCFHVGHLVSQMNKQGFLLSFREAWREGSAEREERSGSQEGNLVFVVSH